MTGIQRISLARKHHGLRGIFEHPDEDQLAVIQGVKRVDEDGRLMERQPDGKWLPAKGYDGDEFDAFELFEPDIEGDHDKGQMITRVRKLIATGYSAEDLAEAGALLAAEIDRIT